MELRQYSGISEMSYVDETCLLCGRSRKKSNNKNTAIVINKLLFMWCNACWNCNSVGAFLPLYFPPIASQILLIKGTRHCSKSFKTQAFLPGGFLLLFSQHAYQSWHVFLHNYVSTTLHPFSVHSSLLC